MDLPPENDVIIITAPRLPDAERERGFSLVTIEERALTASVRLDAALKSVPGVSLFRRTDSAVAIPSIQGLSLRASAPSGAGRTLVLLDGAPLNDPFGGWVIWGATPPETISRARIVRGAGAGPYGAGALLGTLSLEERSEDGFGLLAEAGARGHARAAGYAHASNDKLSLLLAGHAQREDGFAPVRGGRGAADAPVWFDGAALTARLGWRSGAIALSARANLYDEERGAGLVGAQSRASGHHFSAALARLGPTWSWRLQAWSADTDFANSSVTVLPNRTSTTPANDQFATPALGWGFNGALRRGGEAAGAELGVDFRAAEGESRERFRFQGGQFTRSRVAGGETEVAGLYLEAWRRAGSTLLSGGVRFDQWRAFAGARTERDTANGALTLALPAPNARAEALTARFGVRRALASDLSVRSAIYAGFRPPTLNELHRPFRVGNDVTEANPALAPERLTGFDVEVARDGTLSWSVGLFATRLEDAITNVTLGQGPGNFLPGVFVPAGGVFRQRQNQGSIDAAGVEAEARGEWSALDWRVALTYTDAVARGGALDGLRPAQTPRFSAVTGFEWRAFPQTSLSADLSYESERFEDDLNSRTLAPAFVADLRAEHALTPTLGLYAALDNAFDVEVETAETADGVASYGPGRALRVGLRLTR
jgi:outer membrane receptor protein involved in Fe transport